MRDLGEQKLGDVQLRAPIARGKATGSWRDVQAGSHVGTQYRPRHFEWSTAFEGPCDNRDAKDFIPRLMQRILDRGEAVGPRSLLAGAAVAWVGTVILALTLLEAVHW